MCSIMWASPVVPSWSSAEPVLTTLSKLNTGAWWRSTTMKWMPLASTNSWTCDSRVSSPVRTAGAGRAGAGRGVVAAAAAASRSHAPASAGAASVAVGLEAGQEIIGPSA